MQIRHGSLESSILRVLWNLEQNEIYTNSVKDVFNVLSKDSNEKRAYTTIKTVMDRLVLKKVLLKFKQGNKFFYRTAYSCEEMITNSLNTIALRYCDGNLKTLSNILNSMQELSCAKIS